MAASSPPQQPLIGLDVTETCFLLLLFSYTFFFFFGQVEDELKLTRYVLKCYVVFV